MCFLLFTEPIHANSDEEPGSSTTSTVLARLCMSVLSRYYVTLNNAVTTLYCGMTPFRPHMQSGARYLVLHAVPSGAIKLYIKRSFDKKSVMRRNVSVGLYGYSLCVVLPGAGDQKQASFLSWC